MLNPSLGKLSYDQSEDKLLTLLFGTNTDVGKFISKLEITYGTVLGDDVLMQQFCGVHMEKMKRFKVMPQEWKDH